MGHEEMHEHEVEDIWRRYLTTGEFEEQRRQRSFFKILPGAPRCKNCYAPFKGAGSLVVRLFYGKEPSNLNPRICNICDRFAKEHQGGAEIELSLLFADVRGSTQLSETMSAREFSRLIDRFYKTATDVMVGSDALIDKIAGDQVAGMYVPAFSGDTHASAAIEAAREILKATGHSSVDGPWIPLGVGVHTGIAFVGAVGSKDGAMDITVLGEAPNIAARLCSRAEIGQIMVSDKAYESAGLAKDNLQGHTVELKGISEPMKVFVLSS